MAALLGYILSESADEDLDEIYDHTESEFGVAQAVSYLLGLERDFQRLVNDPYLGRDRSDIRADLRSIVSGSHIIFYRILSDHIWIVRVLHGNRYLPSWL